MIAVIIVLTASDTEPVLGRFKLLDIVTTFVVAGKKAE